MLPMTFKSTSCSYIVAQRFGSIWPSCAPLGSSPATKWPSRNCVQVNCIHSGLSAGLSLAIMACAAARIVQVILPSLQRCADKFGDNFGMLLKEIPRRIHHAIGTVSGIADEENARFDAGLVREKRFRSRKCLLDVLRIRDKVGHIHHRRDDVNVIQLKALDDELKPCGFADLDGDGMAIQIGERMDGRIFPHHDALRIVLHRGGHRDEGLPLRIRLENLVRRSHAELRGSRRTPASPP